MKNIINIEKFEKIIVLSKPKFYNWFLKVDKNIVGRKIVDAIIHIYPTNSFIETMIQNNKLICI